MLSRVSFFVKQKTAHEARISDWSSDVCSSDLQGLGLLGFAALQRLDDGEMVHYREVGAIVLADGRLPNRAHVDEQVLGQLVDHLAAAAPEDRLVEGEDLNGVVSGKRGSVGGGSGGRRLITRKKTRILSK